MVDPGDTGIDPALLERFLDVLHSVEGPGMFPDRFTLELRTRGLPHLLHVSLTRHVVRPVVAEDSRKTLVSLPLSRFLMLAERGDAGQWARALSRGYIRLGDQPPGPNKESHGGGR